MAPAASITDVCPSRAAHSAVRVRVRVGASHAPSHGTAGHLAVVIARPADALCGRARVLRLVRPAGLTRWAAGLPWTRRTASAPWAARFGHTSVIDAAGAIYVIGGYDGKYLADVWVSTDGGVDRARAGARGY